MEITEAPVASPDSIIDKSSGRNFIKDAISLVRGWWADRRANALSVAKSPEYRKPNTLEKSMGPIFGGNESDYKNPRAVQTPVVTK